MEHKQIPAQGGTVHYWISRGQPGSMCLVFSHGLTADHTMFEAQTAYFAGKYTVLLWDIPLHGLSRPYRNFSYAGTAEILNAILESERIEKAVLVGMSMGGYPSQFFAEAYPEKTAGFVALDTTPLGLCYYSQSDLWWLKQVAPMASWLPEKLLRWSMARSVSQTDGAYEKMRAMLAPLGKADIVEQMRVAYEYFARENHDAALRCPVLILLGEHDTTGKVKAYCKAWAAKTGYPLHIIQGAKHFSNGDNPEQVNREIEAFLNSLGRKEGNENAAL